MMDKLLVYPENMQRNLELTHGLVFSQTVMLAMVGKGLTREDAYKAVQSSAMKTWETKTPLRQTLAENPAITAAMSSEELDALFDGSSMLKNVDAIFTRCGL
jgi:adenylosuccinate lyase